MLLRSFRWFTFLLLLATQSNLLAADGFRDSALGFSFQGPGPGWKRIAADDVEGGGRKHEFRQGADEDHSVSLIVWPLEREFDLRQLCDSELGQMGARGTVQTTSHGPRTVADREGASVRYLLTPAKPDPAIAIDATYFQTSRFLGRLAVRLPVADRADLDRVVSATIDSLALDAGLERAPTRRLGPFDYGSPDPEQVLTLVHGNDVCELAFSYLEALPGAARSNRGLPVVLAVGDTLEPAARAFLKKYRPGRIRLIGPPHPELPRARPARDDWPTGGTLVVSERKLESAVPAASLALRLEVPLLIDDGELRSRLRAFSPGRVLVLGRVNLPPDIKAVEQLSGPAEVARAAGGAGYIAVANVAAGSAPEVSVLAATLAGVRGGVVLPFDQAVVRHRIPLERTDDCPPGLESIVSGGPGESYLVARIQTDSGEMLAGAAQVGVVRVASDISPRYGRLRIDLDGNGRLDADEEPRIGTSIEVDGRQFHLTYHYGHTFVHYLRPELILDEVDPTEIRREIRALSDALGGALHLALVGTPDQIPFCYQEASGGFEAYDIKQELPSDAPYANLDEDSYLELAVGRLPVWNLTGGSAMIATTIAYPRLKGAWTDQATVIQPGFFELEGELPWVLPNAEALIRGIEGDLISAGVSAHSFYRSDVQIDDVVKAISASGWIAYFNHSGPGAWGIHPGASILTGHAGRTQDRSLPALDGAPIVFGGGCSSAALDVGQAPEQTFPGRFFQLGAVAYLGNTRVAYARSEHLVQLFFARLAAGESTLGEAYRDGRNLLAHLLENGHLMDPLDRAIELGERDFLWGQHRILNLFGDPALRPRRPISNPPAVKVTLTPTARPGRMRLIIHNRGPDRRDPIQMMPASGQGAPEEFFARTGPGMTSSHLPYHFVRDDLEPVRSFPEVQPGAWVDVELPAGARDVSVKRVAGPKFADRGFSVLPGGRGEQRLLMYVPLVRSTLEQGAGPVARRVEFEVRFRSSEGDPEASPVSRQSVPRIRSEERWSRQSSSRSRVSPAARKLLSRISRRYSRERVARDRFWKMPNPQPRLYGEQAYFRGSWNQDGQSEVEARELPTHLTPRVAQIERAIREVADLPFSVPLPELAGLRVDVDPSGGLVLTPLDENEGQRSTEVQVADDGTILSLTRRRFGLVKVTRFEWQETDAGPVLLRRTRRDPARPRGLEIYEVEYRAGEQPPVPERVTLRMPGKLPHDFHFVFRYLRQV